MTPGEKTGQCCCAPAQYADLATALGMAESSVKRMMAKGDMPLSRVDAICRALKLDFAELARRVADAQPLLKELTQEQERAVVADKKLLLCAICVLSQWTLDQIVASYRIGEAECIKYLVQLDRIGIIELRPLNRYRLKLAKTFRWPPHGPVMNYFRDNAVLDYFFRRLRRRGRRAAAGARLDRPQPRAFVPGADAASRTGLRAAAPSRPETAGEGPRRLYAAAGDAKLGVRGLHPAAPLGRSRLQIRLLGPVSSTRDGTLSSLSRKSSWPICIVSGPCATVAPLSCTSGASRCNCMLNSLRSRLRVRIQ
ncbi:MAG: hypothetical protein JWQ13_3015 [Ramlibacter sp.]|nr:hypothetical protein [Ramlibacter sp.]